MEIIKDNKDLDTENKSQEYLLSKGEFVIQALKYAKKKDRNPLSSDHIVIFSRCQEKTIIRIDRQYADVLIKALQFISEGYNDEQSAT